MLTPNKLNQLRDAYEAFRQNNVLPASYEIIYGHAWVAENKQPSKEKAVGINVELS